MVKPHKALTQGFRWSTATLLLSVLLCSSCQTPKAEKHLGFQPNVLFHESDIEQTTGLNLRLLKWAVADFLETVKDQPNMPGSDSLVGAWLVGIKERFPAEEGGYMSLEQVRELEIARRTSKTEKYFHWDVQSMWDFKRLQLGRWSFTLESDHIHGDIFVSSRSKDGVPMELFLRVIITPGEKYVVKDWKIGEIPTAFPTSF